MITDKLKSATAPDYPQKMPVLFLGHGSPMNAIEDNEFVHGFRKVGKEIPKPNAIIVVSAHWETNGTFVTAMEKPKTIHDFGGFPKELYEVQYPAPGSPELAKETKSIIKKTPQIPNIPIAYPNLRKRMAPRIVDIAVRNTGAVLNDLF